MDRDRLIEVAPHYAVMIVLVYLTLGVIRFLIGDLDFWVELAIIAAVVFTYRPLVMRLGVGPDAWE